MFDWKSYDRPKTLSLDVTYKCNLRCTMCDVWKLGYESNRNEMTAEDIVRVAKEFHSVFGIRTVRFLGGEPLLREDLPEVIKTLSPWIETEVVTNGVVITKSVAKKLVGAGLHHLRFSIDGPEAVNDRLRGKGSYRKAVAAIDFVQREKRTQKRQFPVVTIWPCISSINRYHMKDLYLLARRKGARFHMHFLTDLREPLEKTLFQGEAIGSYRAVDPSDLRLSLREQRHVLSEYSRIVAPQVHTWQGRIKPYLRSAAMRVSRRLSSLAYIDCSRSRNTAIVDPWGDLFPCEHLYGYKFGNCLTDGPLVWHSAKRLELRRAIRAGALPVCRECNRLGIYRHLSDLLARSK